LRFADSNEIRRRRETQETAPTRPGRCPRSAGQGGINPVKPHRFCISAAGHPGALVLRCPSKIVETKAVRSRSDGRNPGIRPETGIKAGRGYLGPSDSLVRVSPDRSPRN
jgi:hypothetical protein